MYTASSKRSGFTLIEMLIVVVIIGILISALIPKVAGLKNRANASKAQTDLKNISVWVFQAELNTSRYLKNITNSVCSEYTCRSVSTSLSTLASGHACRNAWESAITLIAQAGGEGSPTAFFKDPWGAPYLLDENEAEMSGSDCRFDSLQSAGPDGRWVHDNNIYPNQNDAASNHTRNKDNILGHLRPVKCLGSY